MKIFLVEDDIWYAEMIKYNLSLRPEYEVIHLETGEQCLERLRKGEVPHVISLDYSLPDLDGSTLLKRIKQKHPHLPVIILSGQEDVATAIKLMQEGADDYIVKNEEAIERLRISLRKLEQHQAVVQELAELKQQVAQKHDFHHLIKGGGQRVQELFKQLAKAAGANITVSITGETGTGKELAARAIHFNSARRDKPFVAVNVAAIPSELIESELFGHEKGAFTGASERRIGQFEQATGGTLFLDEIGEMEGGIQTKILRALQEREITRVGGNKPIKVDFRLIIATHRNLYEEVKAKRFREDLYYRLLGLSIELPPLRDRKEDIPALSKHFLAQYAKDNRMGTISLSSEAQEKLLSYPYPGNIRELRAVVELSAVMCDNGTVLAKDIIFSHQGLLSDMLKEEDTLRGYTRRIVKHYLDRYNNDIDKVAERLDMGRSTLYKMRKDGEI